MAKLRRAAVSGVAAGLMLPALLLVTGRSEADMADDLRTLGLPVSSAQMLDTAIVITMDGSLAEGDTLLKRYGGVFFALLDSVSAGWPVMGLCVDIPGNRLRLLRTDLALAIAQLQDGEGDEVVALWVLEHTRVFRIISD